MYEMKVAKQFGNVHLHNLCYLAKLSMEYKQVADIPDSHTRLEFSDLSAVAPVYMDLKTVFIKS